MNRTNLKARVDRAEGQANAAKPATATGPRQIVVKASETGQVLEVWQVTPGRQWERKEGAGCGCKSG